MTTLSRGRQILDLVVAAVVTASIIIGAMFFMEEARERAAQETLETARQNRVLIDQALEDLEGQGEAIARQGRKGREVLRRQNRRAINLILDLAEDMGLKVDEYREEQESTGGSDSRQEGPDEDNGGRGDNDRPKPSPSPTASPSPSPSPTPPPCLLGLPCPIVTTVGG